MFQIAYTFRLGDDAVEAWHHRVAEFIAAIDADPVLAGRVRYRCLKAQSGPAYVHLAEVADDQAAKLLQEREYFRAYTAEIRRVGGGVVEVTPFSLVAETRS
jgi:hypothetical protein